MDMQVAAAEMLAEEMLAEDKGAGGKVGAAEPMLAVAVAAVVVGMLVVAVRDEVLVAGNNLAEVAVVVRPPIRVAETSRRSIVLRRSVSQAPAAVSRELLVRSRRHVLHNRRFAPERVQRWNRMRDEFNRAAGELVPILPACRAESMGEALAQPVNLGQTMAEFRTATSEPGHN